MDKLTMTFLRMMVVGAMAWCAAGSALAQGAQQFDLVCSGTEVEALLKTIPPKSWSRTYSIDLEKGEWCGRLPEARCAAPQKIAQIEPNQLLLESERSSVSKKFTSINRSSGSVEANFVIIDVTNIQITGTCTVGPFSPMPKTLF